jgi:hypothetical protein
VALPEPGRVCPQDYHYGAGSLSRVAEIDAATLYVVGGLYGNRPALDAIELLAESEQATLVFNGDFHWFDRNAANFADVNHRVLRHHALRGNVETELSRAEELGAGCGCAYPPEVDQQIVDWSNGILSELKVAAQARGGQCAALAALPMTLVATVGGVRIGIVHGDCESLAGWGFSAASLGLPGTHEWLKQVRLRSQIDVFASSHTCLPVTRLFALPSGPLVVANNGAAGMANFAGTRYGIVTRIGTRSWRGRSLHRTQMGRVFIEAVPLLFDHARWYSEFLSQWPADSAARLSYWERIASGPAYTADEAYGFPGEAGPLHRSNVSALDSSNQRVI